MRHPSMITLALATVACAGCAAVREPVASVPPPPLPALAVPTEQPVWSDPLRRPSLAVAAPRGWTEAVSQERRDVTVFVHDSGQAMIAVELRLTGDRALGDLAEDLLVGLGPEVSGSIIATSASGDSAWFGWARHPSSLRTQGARGKFRLVRFPTVPERMAVVSGIWRYGSDAEFAPSFESVAASVQLR